MPRRWFALTLLAVAWFGVAACSAVSGLDRLKFDGTDATGVGGATTSSSRASGSGGQPSASSAGGSGGGGSAPVRIPCFDPGTKRCAVGDVCCVDPNILDGHCDACVDEQSICGGTVAGCDAPSIFVRIACHTDEDCGASGQVCCVLSDAQSMQVTGIACLATCATAGTYPVCDDDQKCTQGATCHPIGYAGYGTCK